MLTLYRITLAPARKPYRIGLLFTHNNGDLGEISVTDGTLFFFKREAGKFSQANIVFICGSCWKQIFCVFVFLRTLYFLLAYNLFQCLHSLQTIYLKISPKSHISWVTYCILGVQSELLMLLARKAIRNGVHRHP